MKVNDPEPLDPDQSGAGPDDVTARKLSFENLDPTEFEELCFDLLEASGYVNVDWRKGTPKNASPSDRGRDLVAARELVDADGFTRLESWFVDAKHYSQASRPKRFRAC